MGSTILQQFEARLQEARRPSPSTGEGGGASHAQKLDAARKQVAARRAEFEAVAREADAAAFPAEQEKTAPLFQLLSPTEAASEKPMHWKIKGLMPYQGIGQVSGASMAAKTFLMLSLAEALADGAAEWYGYRIPEACPVVYISLEGDAGFRVRVRAMQQYRAHEGREPLPDNLQFVIGQEFHIMDKTHVEGLARLCPKGALVVIDTLNASAPDVDENSSKDMGRVVDGMKRLAAAVQGFVLMVAHEGLNTPGRARGSSVQLPAMDLHISVEKKGGRREWRAVKVKDGVESAKGNTFRLALLDMGEDADGDRITSCVAVPDDDPLPEAGKPLTAATIYALDSLKKASEAVAEQRNITGTNAPVPVDIETWRKIFYAGSTADNQPAKKIQFQRARQSLVHQGLATVDHDIYTLTEQAERNGTKAEHCSGTQTERNGTPPFRVCSAVPVPRSGSAFR